MILIVIILAIAGVFSAGTRVRMSPPPSSPLDASTGTDSNGNDFATIPLKAPSGDASGQALVGVATGDQAYVDVSIKNLDPAPQGETYVIWMLLTPKQGYPLAPIQTAKDGTFHNQFPIDSTVLPVVAKVQNINVSLAKVSDVRAELKKAVQQTSLVIDRIGNDRAGRAGAEERADDRSAGGRDIDADDAAGNGSTPDSTTGG